MGNVAIGCGGDKHLRKPLERVALSGTAGVACKPWPDRLEQRRR